MSSAKRDISKFAESLGFTEQQRGKIDIIVSELASNLIKHNAIGGELLVKQTENRSGIELLSLDNGPGMHDTKRMMEDGVSTYGSKGEGLGAVKRLSDEFEIYSQFGIGTFILTRLYLKPDSVSPIKPRKPKAGVNVVMVPKFGETVCGDGWAVIENTDQLVVLAVDGLGHGKDAHIAAQEAVNIFAGCKQCVPSDVIKLIHNSIKKTRGIVGALANIDLKNGTITYCGVGNISGRMITRDSAKSMMSYNGTIGHNIPTNFNNHSFKWDDSNMLILHSDGVRTKWDLSKYTGIEKLDGSLIAAVIYKDNTRKTDDALVMVVRT